MLSAEFIAAKKLGYAFSWTNGANDDIAITETALLIRNTSSVYRLCIERVYVRVDVEGIIDVQCPAASTTTLTGGTDVVGANFNRSSNITAPADAHFAETAIAKGTIVDQIYCYADGDASLPREYNGAIELDTNKSVGFDTIAETGEIHIVVWGYFVRR